MINTNQKESSMPKGRINPDIPIHLGGHADKTHKDRGAMDWFQQVLGHKTFLDIGCGPGGMVELAEQYGMTALGIDGDHTVKRHNKDSFLIHDFTKGPANLPDRVYDIGWCVEFVEHVHAEYIPNYMEAFKKCKAIVMTYAPPNTPGHHHVNCQDEKYWKKIMKKYGFRYDGNYTRELRIVSTMGTKMNRMPPTKKQHRFVKNTGMYYINGNL